MERVTRVYRGPTYPSLHAHSVVQHALYGSASHGGLHVVQELLAVLPQFFGGLCENQ